MSAPIFNIPQCQASCNVSKLAGAAVLLASDASSFTTGSDYGYDGGFTYV